MRALLLIPLFLHPLAATAAADAKFSVEIEGRPQVAGKEIRVPYQTAATLQITPPSGLQRYRLVGLDSDWTDRTGDMFLLVRFLNANGDQIAQTAYQVNGRTPGWNGSVGNSTFTQHRRTLMVPADADHVVVAFSSAGPATTIGTFAVDALEVSASTGNDRRELIGPAHPTEWTKGGTRPSMASTLPGSSGGTIHLIVDDDVTGHADWRTLTTPSTRVHAGETLEVSWLACFCTGMGNPFTITYGNLSPGTYRFEVDALGLTGLPPGERRALTFQVSQPYWWNPWYWAALLLLVSGVGLLVARHLVRKRIQMHLREARMISDERLRIARDLHDGLGARISHISLLGSHAMGSAQDDDSKRIFGEISSMSRELVGSLSETVWMLNPKNDRLESLVDYLCRMVSGACSSLDIRCRIDAPPAISDRGIDGDLRHHATLAVKEAVNNALKHSGCTEIRLGIEVTQEMLGIRIEDNGSGLNAAGNEQGNGLGNIRQRMDALKGTMEIGTSEEAGVAIQLRIPLSR